ncbi:MAG TPA: hypothetical protein VFV30_04210 [Novosphingobium sp.]|nr:hypothetical protein [Novosphingobium sp.]
MRTAPLALALAAGLLAPASVASPAPASLNWLHGAWTGQSEFLGRPAAVQLDVGPALQGTATALVYRVDAAASEGRPALRFEGRGTYRVAPDGTVTGQWADSGGNLHPLSGRTTEGELQVNWGDVRSEMGHSRYSLGPDGVLTVTDSVYSRGTVRVFARASYRRR